MPAEEDKNTVFKIGWDRWRRSLFDLGVWCSFIHSRIVIEEWVWCCCVGWKDIITITYTLLVHFFFHRLPPPRHVQKTNTHTADAKLCCSYLSFAGVVVILAFSWVFGASVSTSVDSDWFYNTHNDRWSLSQNHIWERRSLFLLSLNHSGMTFLGFSEDGLLQGHLCYVVHWPTGLDPSFGSWAWQEVRSSTLDENESRIHKRNWGPVWTFW